MKVFFSSFLGVIAGLFFIFFITIIAGVAIASSSSSKETGILEKSTLKINLDGVIEDRPDKANQLLAELIDQVSKRQSPTNHSEGQVTVISELILTLNQAAHAHPICPVLDKTQGVRLYLPGDPNYAHKRGDEPRVGSTSFWCAGSHYLERVASNPLNDKSPSIWRRIT